MTTFERKVIPKRNIQKAEVASVFSLPHGGHRSTQVSTELCLVEVGIMTVPVLVEKRILKASTHYAMFLRPTRIEVGGGFLKIGIDSLYYVSPPKMNRTVGRNS